MTGILAQLVALTSYGNAFLQADEAADDFYPGHSTFQFCNGVNFVKFSKGLLSAAAREVPVAGNPNEWFRHLKKTGCKKVRLFYKPTEGKEPVPDYKLAGMAGGGGTWMIETIYKRYSHYWFNRWVVTQRDDPGQKIWSVSYGMIDKDQPVSDRQADLQQTHSLLDQSLVAITDFAISQQFSEWADVFKRARAVLSNGSPDPTYSHPEILVAQHYSLIARQLLSAASAAWVFGGMGSWNDLSLQSEEENKIYHAMSADLYDAINQSVLAVANSY